MCYFFIAIDPDNTIYVSNNQLRFANNHNLSSCCISNCILNKSSTHKGWKFYRIDNINEYMLFTPNNLNYELY